MRIFGRLHGRNRPKEARPATGGALETLVRICGDVYRFGMTPLRPF